MIIFSLNSFLSRKIISTSTVFYNNFRGYASASHYEVLGVKKNASQEEIKNAFYAKSRKLHPDKHNNDPKKHGQFVKISEAYTTLSSREGRWEYDTGMPYGVPKPVYYKMRTPTQPEDSEFNNYTFRLAVLCPIGLVIFTYLLYFDILRTAPRFDDGDRFLQKVYDNNDEYVNMNKFYWSLDLKTQISLDVLPDKEFTEAVRAMYQSSEQCQKDLAKKAAKEERKKNYVSVYKIDARPKSVRDAEAALKAQKTQEVEQLTQTKS
ncbi:hypothetical protein LOTGIDRAFT_235183 [Lottia gigantea]|uniref:J domain-containing protein n=1 Tax=Lottia gigantea TaxID=225164 RepID=V3ZVV9_LOTGI|nr:hypothetical protein LOTGIDRAFT_235183 [Lottia gigantea]ESO86750.1 hypothetical protein LOTGIDRAFT_235183 [Lottia gigantea]